MSATGKYSDYTTAVYLQIIGGGVDYDSGPYTVTFPAEEESVSLRISINDDNIFEHDENFVLTINASSLPTGVYTENLNETIVTIVDDDGKQNG